MNRDKVAAKPGWPKIIRSRAILSMAILVMAVIAYAVASHTAIDKSAVAKGPGSTQTSQAVSLRSQKGLGSQRRAGSPPAGSMRNSLDQPRDMRAQTGRGGNDARSAVSVANARRQAVLAAVSQGRKSAGKTGSIDSVSPPPAQNQGLFALLAPEASDPGIVYPPPGGGAPGKGRPDATGSADPFDGSAYFHSAPEADDPGIAYPAPEAGDLGIAYPAPEDGG